MALRRQCRRVVYSEGWQIICRVYNRGIARQAPILSLQRGRSIGRTARIAVLEDVVGLYGVISGAWRFRTRGPNWRHGAQDSQSVEWLQTFHLLGMLLGEIDLPRIMAHVSIIRRTGGESLF